ncbi:MAG: hypothetical protein EB034_21365, partial [Verrucomicrobia bacterium]|nr:hypothetical protein [Verrucomicrobiota bacterium]
PQLPQRQRVHHIAFRQPTFAGDAHRLDHFNYLRLGTGVARKGWLTKGDVVNTLSLGELRKALKGKRH